MKELPEPKAGFLLRFNLLKDPYYRILRKHSLVLCLFPFTEHASIYIFNPIYRS